MSDLTEALQRDLAGTYTIQRELGGGGMSRVFLARDVALGRDVVIKVLPPDLFAGVNAERFEREVKLAAGLTQANIVPVLAAGTAGGLPYYVMPFVEGASLRARIARGPMPVREVVAVLRDLLRALGYAHDRGIVHRDIKPDNILLSGDAAVVTDFGIAKALRAAKGDAVGHQETLTSLGTSLGTPAYMAPEQAAGDPAADHRVDIYALGCVAYEMLTGASPFAGRAPQGMIAAQISESPAPVGAKRADCPPSLAALVMKCLEKDPGTRPATARDVVAALDNDTAAAPARKPRLAKSLRIAIAAAVLIELGISGVTYFAGRRGKSSPAASVQRLAVLPFQIQGGDSTQEYLSEGLTDELTAKLGSVPGLSLIARSSAYAFKGQNVDPRDVGAKLHVDRILQGSFRRLAGRVRITADLVDAKEGTSLSTQTFERSESELPQLRDDIATGIIAKLGVTRSGTGPARPPVKPEAYDLYLRGRHLSSLGTRDALNSALDYFARAAAIDPTFAEAHSAAAYVWLELADGYISSREGGIKARAEAERAIALDSMLAEAHALLADAILESDQNWTHAKQEIDRAFAISPTDLQAQLALAQFWWFQGEIDRAMVGLRQAIRSDPFSPVWLEMATLSFVLANQPDSAIATHRQQLKLDSTFAYIEPFVTDAFRAKGMTAEAARAERVAAATLGRPTVSEVISLAQAGRRDDARRRMEEIERWAKDHFIPPEFLARGWLAIGDDAKAVEGLRTATRDKSPWSVLLNLYPDFQRTRGKPAFAEWWAYVDASLQEAKRASK